MSTSDGKNTFFTHFFLHHVGDWPARGWKVTPAEGNSSITKREGQAGAGPGGPPSNLQNRGLWFWFWSGSNNIFFGHQNGERGPRRTWTIHQVTHESGEAQTKDNDPKQACGILLLSSQQRIRVAPHPSAHIYTLSHAIHHRNGFHLPICPVRNQRVYCIPSFIPAGQLIAASRPWALRDRPPTQQQQRGPVGSLPALPNHPQPVTAATAGRWRDQRRAPVKCQWSFHNELCACGSFDWENQSHYHLIWM